VADISVERKRRSPMGLILAVLLLAAIAAGVWWFLGQGEDRPAEPAPAAAPPAATAPNP